MRDWRRIVKIRSLKLTNFRGAVELALTLDDRLNVFVGVNGAGKSTVLDAAALALSWAASRIRHTSSSGRPIDEDEVTNGKSTAAIEVSCQSESGTVSWKLSKSRAGHTADEKSSFHELSDYAKSLQNSITETAERFNIPLFAYFPVNRAVLDIPLRIREKHRFTLLSAYDDALTSGANFRTFFEWFREREDLENENRKYQDDLIKPEGYCLPDRQLEAVRLALTRFLPEFRNLTVRRNPLRMEVEKQGERLSVNQLSDGEKCMIALIGDLARRLAIANPVRDNPLLGSGVVLIDEIDLHLHPTWQRLVVPRLLEVFPNCQFIVSTHSPHVITHVKPESLYLLRQTAQGVVAEKPRESYGKNVDRVLEDLMGLATTRPDSVESDLRSLFLAIDRGELQPARGQIEALRKSIGDDPDLVRADVLIRRKEIIGK
jgi:predicted ATP-binding protein involved in virulence